MTQYRVEGDHSYFPIAVGVVTQLVCGDILDELQQQDLQVRARLWTNAAEEFPYFTDTIDRLREVLSSARRDRQDDPGSLKAADYYFQDVVDPVARGMLPAIFMARVSPEHDPKQEAQAMLAEFRMSGEGMQQIHTRQIVESILLRRVRLQRRSPLQKRARARRS